MHNKRRSQNELITYQVRVTSKTCLLNRLPTRYSHNYSSNLIFSTKHRKSEKSKRKQRDRLSALNVEIETTEFASGKQISTVACNYASRIPSRTVPSWTEKQKEKMPGAEERKEEKKKR